MGDESWVRELLIVLGTAGLIVPLFSRLRFGTVPAFLIAGVALGPGGLARLDHDLPWLSHVTFSSADRVQPFAELGVLCLLFLIGLEFSVERLWRMRRLVVGVGSAQFLGSAVLIGVAAGWLSGSLTVGVVAGLALALSSTAIVSQVLIDAHRFATPVGRVSLGVLLFQDLMVVPTVIIVGLLAGEEMEVSSAVARAALIAVVTLAVILFVGRFLIQPAMRLAAAAGSRELVVGVALFLAIGMALLTEAAGLSSALGAFLAGLLLSETAYRHQLEVDIEPFKGLLLGLFFMTVGMSVDVAALWRDLVPLVAAAVALVAVKALVVGVGARLLRVERKAAIEAAFLLAGSGEFAFVAIALARGKGVVDGEVAEFILTLAALTMLAIPLLAGAGRRAGERFSARVSKDRHGVETLDDDESLQDHVIIGGFGRVGETIGRILAAEEIPFVAVDNDGELVAEKRLAGSPVIFGDASRPEILEKLGAHGARAFVVTTDSPDAAEKMVMAIRGAWPGAAIHARALDADHALRLRQAGASAVVPEALEGSLQLAGRVLAELGLPDESVDARIDIARANEVRRLGDQGG